MDSILNHKFNEYVLLDKFNNRNGVAFSEVYLELFDELHYFAKKIFNGENITSEDIVQDTFIAVWENKSLCFSTLTGIKAYMFVSIKNRLITHITHMKSVNKHRKIVEAEDRFTTIISENEILSTLLRSTELLPEECAKVFKLCIDGWDICEIAEQLNKSESTIYKQKNRAIEILREKLSAENLLILLLLMQ